MNTFRYFMPVDTYFGRDCIAEHKDVMKKLGQKALIVTGRTSAKKNGSQQDVIDALEALGMQWVLFDEIGENPDVETVVRAAELAKKEAVDFIVSKKMQKLGDKAMLTRLYNELLNKDWFMTFPDYRAYVAAKEKAYADYENREEWAKKMLVNISKAGFFSSDRTISQYNDEIWHLSEGTK